MCLGQIARLPQLFFGPPSPYYKMIQKGFAYKFCIQNSLATKFYTQSSLPPKLSLQNGLATRLQLQRSLTTKLTKWSSNQILLICTPFLYYKIGRRPPQCLQNGSGIGSTASTVVLPAAKFLLQKDTKGFRT